MVRAFGSHEPNNKNRSSKHLIPLTKHKSFIRSASNKYLNEHVTSPGDIYGKELARRRSKNEKKKQN